MAAQTKSDAEWLAIAREATGLPKLQSNRLTVENGVLTKLDLSDNQLTTLPESVGRLTSLTKLDLSHNQLTTLPESVGQLTSLTELYLRNNKLTTLPESVGRLTSLTELYLSHNQLTTLPESVGRLTSLTKLDLSYNQLTTLPESVGQLTSLTELRLMNNKLTGEVPMWLGQLVNLKSLDLSNNPDLCGSLPSNLSCPNMYTDGTSISSVRIKVKPLRGLQDRLFVVTHVLMGYLDLATDIIAINQFGKEGRYEVMGLNIAFLLLNVAVDVALMPDARGKVLALLQVQQLVQARETLEQGVQTPSFVRSKKLDAVCRSLPSMVLQLYGLLATLPVQSTRGVLLIALSITSGLTGAAMTLGSLAPKSGSSIFSRGFVVHFCYYVCELTMRVVSLSLLFVCLGGVGFAAAGPDWLLRAGLAWVESGKKVDTNTLILSLLLFGSDAANGPAVEDSQAGFIFGLGTTLSSVFLLISLCLLHLLPRPLLAQLRVFGGGRPVVALTVLACMALLVKMALAVAISCMKAEQTQGQDQVSGGEEKEKEKGQGLDLPSLPPRPPAATETRSRQSNPRTRTYEDASDRVSFDEQYPDRDSISDVERASSSSTDNPMQAPRSHHNHHHHHAASAGLSASPPCRL